MRTFFFFWKRELFFSKSGPQLSVRCGVRAHPSHPPWLRACAGLIRVEMIDEKHFYFSCFHCVEKLPLISVVDWAHSDGSPDYYSVTFLQALQPLLPWAIPLQFHSFYLTLGQQVVFQKLELQESPLSPPRLPSGQTPGGIEPRTCLVKSQHLHHWAILTTLML